MLNETAKKTTRRSSRETSSGNMWYGNQPMWRAYHVYQILNFRYRLHWCRRIRIWSTFSWLFLGRRMCGMLRYIAIFTLKRFDWIFFSTQESVLHSYCVSLPSLSCASISGPVHLFASHRMHIAFTFHFISAQVNNTGARACVCLFEPFRILITRARKWVREWAEEILIRSLLQI